MLDVHVKSIYITVMIEQNAIDFNFQVSLVKSLFFCRKDVISTCFYKYVS